MDILFYSTVPFLQRLAWSYQALRQYVLKYKLQFL